MAVSLGQLPIQVKIIIHLSKGTSDLKQNGTQENTQLVWFFMPFHVVVIKGEEDGNFYILLLIGLLD